MGYSMSHSGLNPRFDPLPRKKVLETEKRVLQHRIEEIELELNDLSRQPYSADDIEGIDEPVAPLPRGKWEDAVESVFATALGLATIVGLALLIL